MKSKIFLGMLMATAIASCTHEDALTSEYGVKTLNVSVEENKISSRVGFTDGDADFFWSKSDKIGVTTTASFKRFQGMDFQGNGGESSGTFKANMSGDPSGYAVYPFDDLYTHSMNGTTLTYQLPSSYVYASLDETYANPTGNSHNAPMWGKIEGQSASFKHLGGVVAVEINNLPANTSDLTFTFTASSKINGSFTVDLATDEPEIITTAQGVSSEEKKVTISFGTSTNQTKGYFYIPVPTGTYDWEVKVTDADGLVKAQGLWDEKLVERRDIYRLKIGEATLEGGEDNGKIVASVSDIAEALNTTEDNLAVKVTGEVKGTDNTITIPASLQTETTTFTFVQVAADAKITITEETANSYDGVIIIEVPEGTATSQIEANVPSGEVYIKQGNVTNLLVSSKDETTIIGAEVTVGTLTVKKGNVRIENGGSVNTINRSEENEDLTYVIYESATAPYITLGEGVVLVSEGEWDLRKAVKEGGEVKLTSDFALSTPLVIGSDMVLDLNGYTLSYTSAIAGDAMITNNGTLTIKDTSAEADGKITYSYTGEADTSYGKGNYTIYNNGTLTLESGTVENSTVKMSHASYAINTGAGATLTINGGKVLNVTGHAVRMVNFGSGKNTMTVSDGYIEGTRAIQMQLPGSEQSSAPEMSLTIAGGELKSNEDTYNLAVYVFSNGQSGENVSVTVEDGVINGNIAINGAATPGMKDGAVSVSGGTIKGKYGVFSYAADEVANGKISITGGTFKSNYCENYVAPGYAFVKDGDVYKVEKDASKAVVTSLEQLNTALTNEAIATIQLGEDLTFSEILVINRAITLDGNGKKLTSSASRAINVSGADGVTIKNLTIDASGERAINIIQNATNVTIDNVKATAFNYTVNVASSAPNAVVTINESTLNGLNVVNVASAGAEVTVTNSTINCNDNNETEGEAYAALCLNKDAIGGKIMATGCTINVTEGSDSTMGRNGAENGTVTINNSTDGVQISVAYVQFGDYYYGYSTLEAAFNNDSSNGNTIVLIRDIVLSETLIIPSEKKFTLDLNGKTISQANAQTTAYAMITNKGTLTIKDSATDGKITYEDTGNGGEYASNTISNQGVLTLESGTIENTSSETVMNNGYPHTIDVYQGSTTNIKGGTVKSANYDCIRMFCNSTTQATTVNISGGNIINRVTFQNPSSNQAGYGVLNITGGTFTSTTGKVNVRLLNFSTDVSNMKAEVSGGTFDQGVGISNYCNNWSSNWDWLTIENDVINKVVTNAEELSAAIIKGGKIILAKDITVEKWVMFSETKTIGNGNIITVTMNGLMIDGNGKTLTINSIESAGNGNHLFDNASKLNIYNLTINYADGLAGGISLKSGVISGVNFVGGGNIIYPGTGDIKVENCTFASTGNAFYFEQERDNLTVTGCTFNLPVTQNVILLRGDVKFTNNIVNSGRTVNVVSGSPLVTGNDFKNVRLKVYSAATATISNNTINTLAFEDNATTYASTFTNNTLSDEAQAVLNAMNKN